MREGDFIFAVISIIDGKIVVDLGNTADYMTVRTEDGIVKIVERK